MTTPGSDKQPSGTVSLALHAIATAARAHPEASALGVVLAVALTGATARLFFSFSAREAATFMALVIAAWLLILPLIPSRRRAAVDMEPPKPRPEFIVRLTTWVLAILLLISAGFETLRPIVCAFGYACETKIPKPVTVSLDRLDERQVDASKQDHVLRNAIRVSRNTLSYAPGSSPIISMVGIIDNFGRRPDGSIGITVEMHAGPDEDHLVLQDRRKFDDPNKWQEQGIVKRYPAVEGGDGGSMRLKHDLQSGGMIMSDQAFVLVPTLTCLSPEMQRAGKAVVRLTVWDTVNNTIAISNPINLNLVERIADATRGCSSPA